MSNVPWSDAEVAALRKHYQHETAEQVAARLGRRVSQVRNKVHGLGLKKPAEWLASEAARRFGEHHASVSSRFQPGQPAWNKGIRGVVGVQEACRAHQFKAGRPAHEARNYQPIGTLRLSKDGYLERKVTDDPGIVPAKRWVGVHRLVWQAVRGDIPPGRVVVFRCGMQTAVEAEIVAERLECITRAELMDRNSYHKNLPPEVARIVQLRGAIQRQINKRTKDTTT